MSPRKDPDRAKPVLTAVPNAASPDDVSASPSREQVLDTVLALARIVNVEMEDAKIVGHYLDALTHLFPSFDFSVRLTSPETRRISLFQTSVDTAAAAPAEVALSREALRRHSLKDEDVETPGIRIVDEDDPNAFDVPLLDEKRVAGVLRVEFAAVRVSDLAGDRAVIVQLALSLEGLLRSARLLRESRYLRDYLSQLIDNANAPIMVIGRHRTIKVVNRALLTLTGMSRDNFQGRDFLEMLPEDERPRIIPTIVNALRGEPVSNYEVRLLRRGGGFARIAINTASMMGPDGEIDGVIVIGRDLTEVRELEEQIVQAEKLATLGQLAAGVVHELNNPLTSISVYSEYLHKKLAAENREDGDVEKLRRIHQNTERILRFTRDLVTYARPSTGSPAYVSLHDVLDQAVVFCDHVIDDHGAVTEHRYTDSRVTIFAIKAQLHQVFINLITNACHAMPEGAGRLIIETRLHGDEVQVRLTDNGPGIPVEQQDRIFEPFYSTKGEGKGTGLGLSIVKNIVTQHGGDLRVLSEVGSGATFELTFPFHDHEPTG